MIENCPNVLCKLNIFVSLYGIDSPDISKKISIINSFGDRRQRENCLGYIEPYFKNYVLAFDFIADSKKISHELTNLYLDCTTKNLRADINILDTEEGRKLELLINENLVAFKINTYNVAGSLRFHSINAYYVSNGDIIKNQLTKIVDKKNMKEKIMNENKRHIKYFLSKELNCSVDAAQMKRLNNPLKIFSETIIEEEEEQFQSFPINKIGSNSLVLQYNDEHIINYLVERWMLRAFSLNNEIDSFVVPKCLQDLKENEFRNDILYFVTDKHNNVIHYSLLIGAYPISKLSELDSNRKVIVNVAFNFRDSISSKCGVLTDYWILNVCKDIDWKPEDYENCAS